MRHISTHKSIAAVLVAALVATITMLVAAPKAQASIEIAGTPCPSYSVQDVFDDPNGDWDNDGITNKVEFLNGQNPCTKDDGTFCKANPSLCSRYKWYRFCQNNSWTRSDVEADPKGDWDGDGFTNSQELKNGTNPCLRPCPNPSTNELNAEPHGDWDNDGYSNITEVRSGSDPCNSRSIPNYVTHRTYVPRHHHYYSPHGYYVYVPAPLPTPTPKPVAKPLTRAVRTPCPNWTRADVNASPHTDWDRDGITNIQELRNGTNPCVHNRQGRSSTSNQAHSICPSGYPHYHPGTGKCHVNPIRGN